MTDKEKILEAIEQKRQAIWPTDTGEMKPATVPNNLEQGWLNALTWMEKYINSLPAKHTSEDVDVEINLEYKSNYKLKELTLEEFRTIVYHFTQWKKEQLMKNVVETKVKGRIDGKGIFIDTDIPIGIDVNEGDKVKIIIIKEDEE